MTWCHTFEKTRGDVLHAGAGLPLPEEAGRRTAAACGSARTRATSASCHQVSLTWSPRPDPWPLIPGNAERQPGPW